VIHAQNKHALIPAVLAGRLLGVPVFLTIRDGSIIDAAPVCLHHNDRMPADCGVRKLWTQCSEEYADLYARGRNRLRTKLAFLYFWLDSRLKQRFLRRVDTVVGVSRGILDVYRRSGLLEGVRATRVVYNVPPIPPPAEDLTVVRRRLGVEGRRVVLYVGKLSPGKGFADLVAASADVVREVPDVVFLFVGEGALGREGPHLRHLGPMPNAHVQQLYPAADIVVVPSVIPDALSRVILEAMAAGRPVIATDVGGTAELVVDGVTGVLVPRAAPAVLARALVGLLKDDDRRAVLGAGARRRITEHFSPDNAVDELIAAYELVLDSRAQGTSSSKHGVR
jgi:glycosyltransferase involved in cell wall biosynthesis